MTRSRPLAATLVVLFVSALPFGAGPAEADLGKIQPGDVAFMGGSQCTLNFVFDGSGKTYVGIAAHCVDEVGQIVSTSQYGAFGEVAFIGDADSTALDFAFIEVYPEFDGVIDPSVRGHPQYPTGHTLRTDTLIGDIIQVSGHGVGYDLNYNTETRRQAVHTGDDSQTHSILGPVHFGDSGGPLVHVDTGKAYGIVSRLCLGACSETGPTVEGILFHADRLGFPVTLRTV